MPARKRIVIMGAGGRDFHVFNVLYRDDPRCEVVAFTAAQIPHIDRRSYPPVLAGPLYPSGIAIRPEADLEAILREGDVAEVVFAYSDVSYEYLGTMERRVRAAGAAFSTFDPASTQLQGTLPCIAVCAVRTGCGKSPLSRHLVRLLRALGRRPVVIRHPMPYGNLREQVVQRFSRVADFQPEHCTIEEMEEYEPHVEAGSVVFAGADYAKVLDAAEAEGDVIVWDGGNNDASFVRPTLSITVLDPLRAGDEVAYFPGRWNLEHADVVVIAKADQASAEQLRIVRENIDARNPEAQVVEGRLRIRVGDESLIRGRRVLVVEDGPTVTHGGMGYGAGYIAAKRGDALAIVDPRPFATGEIAEAYETYPHLRDVVPALGYAPEQLRDLETTIERADCDTVVVGTPIDLSRVVRIPKPHTRVSYAFEEVAPGSLHAILEVHLGHDVGMGQ